MLGWHDIPEAAKLIPGAFGSLFSMLFLKETAKRMFLMFLGGVAFSYYATGYTVKLTGFDPGIAGFLLGLFGMSMISSLFAGWQKLDMSIIMRDLIRLVLRLPAIPPHKEGETK